MDVEILSYEVKDGIVKIQAIDVSEQNLQRLERLRDDGQERELEFVFDTFKKGDYKYLRGWLKKQKATREAKTWGEALTAIIGSITVINGRYRSWQ